MIDASRASRARPSTPIDQIADGWMTTQLDLFPELRVDLGAPGREGEYADYSPDGAEQAIIEAKKVLARITNATPVDDVDRITKLDLIRDLALSIDMHDAGFEQRDLNVIASPAQNLRDIFDLMPTATETDWSHIATRLHNLPAAMAGYRETLRSGIASGNVPALRQVAEIAAQARKQVAGSGFFFALAHGASGETSLPASMVADLDAGAREAAAAYGELADFLQNELAPHAPKRDAVGRELYSLASRGFLGAVVDLDETYEWGIGELNRMVTEQESIAREIVPGAGVAEAIAFLEKDPARKLHGTAALQRWMQEKSDQAIEDLAGSQFDIPDELRKLECLIAPTQEGGIYYTGPTEDFSRGGRMWWSVPEGVTEFDTWRELTTVYHEGVPGHHLQVGQATYNTELLNSWRRQNWTSGHGEGWALYAERLMEQLGYLDDPGDRLGMLDGQRMRAARVVLDIGVHLEKELPDGSGKWTGDYAFGFLGAHVNMSEQFVRFEVNRYLGWPGQAPSYKVGQRIWEQLRDELARREGRAFDIKAFHKRALDIGSVGLDTLRSALLD